MKNIILNKSFFFALFLITISINTEAQQFNYWQAGASSDWYGNINWSAGTNYNCDCVAGDDRMIAFDATTFQNYFNIQRPHQNGTWIGTGPFELGPNASVSVRGQSQSNGSFNDDFIIVDPCSISCSGAFGVLGIPITTEPLRPPTNVSHSYTSDGKITVNWAVTTDLPESQYLFTWGWNGATNGNFFSKTVTSMTICIPEDNATLSIWTRESVGNGHESVKVDINVTQGPASGGSIIGKVETLSGTGVEGVIVKATLQNPQDFTCSLPLEYFSGPSESGTGNYSIVGLKYWSGGNLPSAEYEVEAFLDGHSFRTTPDQNSTDSTRTYMLSNSLNDFTNAHFYDIKTYDILGKVEVGGDCGLDDAQITAVGPGGSMSQTSVSTSGDGTFSLVLSSPGQYDIIAKYQGIPFDTIPLNVTDNVVIPDILYPHTDTIHGFSGAGCLEVIGQMTIEARTPTGCPITTVTTNPSGFYELVVPTVPLELQVIGYNPQNSGLDFNDVYPAIDSIYGIDMDSTLELNIQYRKPIIVNVENMPPPPCPSTQYPVLNQDEEYTITINIWEALDICRADTGSVTISDDISTFGIENPIMTSAEFAQGKLQYTFKAGDPALSAPFLKNIVITAFVDNEVATLSIPVIVSGTRIRTSTITSAPSDSIPFLILRDPPGDKSKAWFSQSNTTSYGQSYSHEVGGSVKIWAKAKPSFLGILWGQISGSLEVGGTRKSATEINVTMETTDYFETSPSGAFIGEDGDLIMGAAVNFKYGLSDDRFFDLNTCSIVVDTSLVFSPETFESSYRHSVKFIKEDIIPKLEFLSQYQDTTEEARRKFANKLLVWEQILQLNRDLKEDALVSGTNFGFDAGASQTSTITGSSSRKASLEFTTFLDAEIALSAGVKLIGFEGEAGVAVKIRSEWGNSSSESSSSTTSTGYTFQDDDPGDNHFFKFAIDSVYGTPVFEVLGGASSCPHEDNTQFIDLVKLTFDMPVMIEQAGEDFLDFDFTIQNLGETDASNQYFVDLVDDNNPGATITFNGNPIIDPGIQFNLNAGQSKTGTIRVTRPGGDQYVFEGIQFEAFAGCFAAGNPFPDKTFKSTAFISAYFMNDCSNINLTSPSNDWLINQSSGDMIPVTMDQYVLGSIDNVRLMYANQKDGEWKESNINIPGANLLAPPQNYMWDVSGLMDGNYVIRWELECGSTLNYSPRSTGKIDRSAPRVFGVEKPTNDLYFLGDEISCQFNEEIDFSILTNNHIYLKTIPEGTFIPVEIQGSVNEVILVLQERIDSMYNQTFEVGVFGIVDLSGNVKTDTAKWEFVVSEPDSDKDGVPDTQDRCPGGDDFEDTDMDGLPDDCDCVPTIPQNGQELSKAAMHFDGVDDQIVIPHDAAFDMGQSFTFESWVNLDEFTISETILSKGAGGNGNTSYIFSLYQNKLALFIGGGGATATWIYSDTDIEVGVWMHAAVSYDQITGEFTFYLDGVSDGVRTIPHGFYNGSSPVYIGRQGQFCNCNFLAGQLEDVRFWNVAKSESDIQATMHIELEGNESGLIAYYNLNDGIPFGDNGSVTQVKDISPNGFDGSAMNFAKTGNSSNWVNSPVSTVHATYDLCKTCTDTLNTAIDFDGINDRVDIAHQSDFSPITSNAMTFESWVFPGNKSGFKTIVSKAYTNSTDYMIYLEGNKLKLFMQYSNPDVVISLSDIPDLKWTHVAVVFNLNEVKFYINGVLDITQTITLPSTMPASPLRLGDLNETFNLDANFKGRMDDVRFWNDVRTPAEISDHLYTELIGDEPGLFAYYNMNAGLPSGNNAGLNSVADVTGNNNHGSLVDFNKFGMFSNWVKSPLRFSGDVDEDGRPDVCDNCIPDATVLLENQILDGVYRAREEITLGNGIFFLPNSNITFRSPKLTVLQNITKPASVNITVRDRPCEE